jgi:hypothetical protein
MNLETRNPGAPQLGKQEHRKLKLWVASIVSRLHPAALDRYLAAVPAMSRSPDRSIPEFVIKTTLPS